MLQKSPDDRAAPYPPAVPAALATSLELDTLFQILFQYYSAP